MVLSRHLRSICFVAFLLILITLTGYATQNKALDYAWIHYESEPDTSFFLAKREYLKSNDKNYPVHHAKSAVILGKILFYQGSFQQASEYLMEASEIYEILKDEKMLAHAYTWLAAVYQYARQFPLAYEYYEQGLKVNKIINYTAGLAESYGWIGHYFEKTGMPDTALILQTKALNLYRQINDLNGMARIYDNIGSLYEDNQIFDSAYFYFNNAYKLNISAGNINSQLVNLNNLGDVHRKKGELDQALKLTDKALDLANKHDLVYQIRSAYRDKAKIFALMNLMDSAFFYQEKAYDLYSVIFSHENARRIALLQSLYETERKENQIALLEKNKAYNRVLRLVLFGAFIIFLFIGGLVLYQQRLKIRQNTKINEQRAKIHETKDELIKEQLKNVMLNEERLKVELENRRLQGERLKQELSLKSQMLTSHTLQIIRKNNFLEELKSELRKIKNSDKKDRYEKVNSLIKSININFAQDDDWNDFQQIFEQVHPDFFTRLSDKYPDLSATELRLCALLKLNLSSSDIASIMNISQDSLRVARYRLRKKLTLEKNTNLFSFVMNY